MTRSLSFALVLLWTSTAHANPEITVDLPGGTKMEFVWIEPGTFTMGSPSAEAGRGYDEQPQHQVTLQSGKWLAKHELTQGQWQSVMETAPWSGMRFTTAAADRPAVYISWDDAQELVHALNQTEGDSLFRLPTEAEWEYACRAGTTTSWSCGEDEGRLGEYAWYIGNAWDADMRQAQPVGTKLPNPWGLHDMHGNVIEWVQDYAGPYTSLPQVDPPGTAYGSFRLARGGGFYNHWRYTRSACRVHNFAPGYREYDVGMRLLMMGSATTPVTPGTWGRIKSSD